MRRIGFLEAMARADLDALLEAVGRDYRPGTLERVSASDPEWREAIEQTERDAGTLYEALCRADTTLARWRQAVAELHRLWARIHDAPGRVDEEPSLEEVA